jgi:hypothetical protein
MFVSVPSNSGCRLSLLVCPIGRRRDVGDVTGGLERANGRAVSEARVGRVGELYASETLYRGLGEAENRYVGGC